MKIFEIIGIIWKLLKNAWIFIQWLFTGFMNILTFLNDKFNVIIEWLQKIFGLGG